MMVLHLLLLNPNPRVLLFRRRKKARKEVFFLKKIKKWIKRVLVNGISK
jgi:hypothetical protein